jgi:hypothetical protein
MVTFVCYHCDQTLKKKQVETHIYRCVKPAKLACIGIWPVTRRLQEVVPRRRT